MTNGMGPPPQAAPPHTARAAPGAPGCRHGFLCRCAGRTPRSCDSTGGIRLSSSRTFMVSLSTFTSHTLPRCRGSGQRSRFWACASGRPHRRPARISGSTSAARKCRRYLVGFRDRLWVLAILMDTGTKSSRNWAQQKRAADAQASSILVSS